MNNYFLKLVLGLFVATLFVLVSKALAEDSPPEILITPSRFKQKQEQNSRSVQVIDEAQIKRSNYRNVLDVLRRAVGVDIVQAGGLGRSSSAFIRGAESDHTLIMIDGIRVNDPNVGSFDLADLQLNRIEKIEIIRGASSAAYGSEAIGGVINIITKEPGKEESVKASVQGGSYGTHGESIDLAGGSDRLVNGATLSYLTSDGISAANSSRGNPENDSYKNLSFSTRNKLKISDQTTLSWKTRSLQAKTNFDGFDFTVGAVDDPNFYQDRVLNTAGAVLESQLEDDLKLKSEISYTNERIEGKDGNDVFNNYNIRGENRFASIGLNKKFNKNNVTSIGVDYLNRQAVNKANFVRSRDTIALWAEHTVTVLKNLTTNFGLRSEQNNDFGSIFVYDFSPKLNIDRQGSNIHSSIGTGYKAPSFNELYFPNFGNPNLNAEKSRSYDLGVKKVINSKMWFDSTLFYNDFEDLITFDTTTFLAENISNARARGVENQFDYRIAERTGFNLNYVYTDTEDKMTHQALARRARHKAGLQFYTSPIDDLDLSFSYTLANSRKESDGQKMDNYELLAMSATYYVTERNKIILRADNLLDEKYEELPGYGVPGFSVYAGVEFALY